MKIAVFFLILMMLSPLAFADNGGVPLELSAESQEDEIYVGDIIKVNVTARNRTGYEILFPEVLGDTGEFTFVKSVPIEEGWGSKGPGRVYMMSIYTTGTHVMPPIEVMYRETEKDEWQFAQSPQVPLEIRSLLAGDYTDIKDLKGLEGYGGGVPWFLIAILPAAAACAAGRYFWNRWKEEKLAAAAPLPAHEIAYRELRQLKNRDLPGHGRVKEYYSVLSDIVRHYLENRFLYKAPEMTTEEFLESIRRSVDLETEHKELLKDFLSHCDLVKFAKYGPTPIEMLDSYNAAERLVDQTKVEEFDEDEEIESA